MRLASFNTTLAIKEAEVAHVHLGYFEDFKSDNTLLLEGDVEGLEHLEQALRSLAIGEVKSLAIHALEFVEAHQGVQLFAYLSARDLGISRNESGFQWPRTSEGWEETADKIAAVKDDGHGHHYLDATKDEFTVMVSSGEYGSQWWAQNG